MEEPKARRSKKQLLSEYLLEHYFDNELRVTNAVKTGIVSLNGKVVKRAGITIHEDKDKIEVIGGGQVFVS
ncbi:MAG TPA: hypothetical protein V6C96_04400, partial [Vampirovibrionales bacterium]